MDELDKEFALFQALILEDIFDWNCKMHVSLVKLCLHIVRFNRLSVNNIRLNVKDQGSSRRISLPLISESNSGSYFI